MTQTISAPIDLDTATTATELACPDFCDDTCKDRDDLPGNLHHTSGFDSVEIFGGKHPLTLDVSTSRSDDEGKTGEHVVNLLALHDNFGTCMTAGQARQVAALLLNAADMADPLPLGVLAVQAQHARIGDQIRTENGWQNVVGQMAFDDLVSVWTDVLDRDPDTGGWSFQPTDVVILRRRVHGSSAIAFVEPIR